MKVWIVIPAYNENGRLAKVLISLPAGYPVVVVDDGSAARVNTKKAIVLRHEINLGKGAAMKTGADYAFSQGADAVIFMDADGQHRATDISTFTAYLNWGYDVVIGSRRPSLQTPLVRLLGNKFASIYMNIVFGIYITDIVSGFRALTKKAYALLRWDSGRYGVETEMIARLGLHKTRLRYIEFPIESVYIDKYKGVTLVHALEIFGHTLWWKLYWVFKFWR